MPRPRRNRTKMFALIEQFQSSGLTRGAFCARKKIPVSTLDWWRNEYKKSHNQEGTQNRDPAFLEVALPHAPVHNATDTFIIRLGNGVSIQCPRGISIEELQPILGTLRSHACSA